MGGVYPLRHQDFLDDNPNLFLRNTGPTISLFNAWLHISGDDDLFINEAATRGMCRSRFIRKAFMFSKPKLTMGEYFKQKTRHLNTGNY